MAIDEPCRIHSGLLITETEGHFYNLKTLSHLKVIRYVNVTPDCGFGRSNECHGLCLLIGYTRSAGRYATTTVKKMVPRRNRSSILQLRPNSDSGINLGVLSRVATVFPHRAQKVLRGHCVGSQLLCAGCQVLEYPSPSE